MTFHGELQNQSMCPTGDFTASIESALTVGRRSWRPALVTSQWPGLDPLPFAEESCTFDLDWRCPRRSFPDPLGQNLEDRTYPITAWCIPTPNIGVAMTPQNEGDPPGVEFGNVDRLRAHSYFSGRQRRARIASAHTATSADASCVPGPPGRRVRERRSPPRTQLLQRTQAAFPDSPGNPIRERRLPALRKSACPKASYARGAAALSRPWDRE
jgi:hypothetical protein